MYGAEDKLLYVGKAKQLRKRVSSYFRKTNKSPKTQLLVSRIERIETRIVGSEIEALVLENNLIKRHKPRFNVLLRDDKTYLYLRITAEPIPRMMITRRLVRDGSFYAGPKTNSRAFRKLMAFCQKLFQVRTCRLSMEIKDDGIIVTKNPENRKLPCLDYHIGKCNAPCTNVTSADDYLAQISALKRFLRGDIREVKQLLTTRMERFVADKKFEAAAKVRDMLLSVEPSTERQHVEFTDGRDRDVLGLWRIGKSAHIVRLVLRGGKLIDQTSHTLRAHGDTLDSEVIEQFLLQFYPSVDQLPHEVLLPTAPECAEALAEGIEELQGAERKLVILTPQRGKKKRVIEMAEKNARHAAEKAEIEEMSKRETFAKALPELAEALGLSAPPKRIEGYDISHLQGTHTTASMVVFTNGESDSGQYRRFKVKTLDGKIDDFAAMKEVLGRRFAKADDEWFAAQFPDLIVIDGGKGQLSSVMKAVADFDGFPDGFDPMTQIISLAKREEEIFRPEVKTPLILGHETAALKLLQRVRDESHRFALGLNRKLRVKAQTHSALDDVPGIGPKTKKALMQKLGSVSAVRNATNEELLEILNEKQLKALRQQL